VAAKHVAVYVRVSTKQQDHKSQEPDLQRWADTQDLPVRWYRDTYTGRSMQRPAWEKLYAAILRGEVASRSLLAFGSPGEDRKGPYRTF
jgi:DNA invertase Pin-like site-specific DNA recombinase